MSQIASPHDRFFRSSMADIRVAKEFFDCHVSALVKKHMDWNTLALCPNSYIDKSLKLAISDILYQVTIAEQKGYLYLLAEHQSRPDKLMPFRIWQYILAIQADHLKKNQTDYLPLVYPLVFYHGKVVYPYSTDIKDLIAAPSDLIDQVLFKPFQLVDTHTLVDEELKRRHWAGVMEFMMKHIFARDIAPYLKQLLGIFRDIEKTGNTDYIITVLNYALTAGKTDQFKQLIETLKVELSPATEEKIMTIAEMLMEEGIVKGEEKGKTEGVRIVAMRLLEKGSHPQFVAEVTGLSMVDIQQLQEALITA